MAEQQDQSSKTEQPTGKRLEEAFEKGNIARSAEVSHWMMILASTLVLLLFGAALGRELHGRLLRFLEAPHAIPTDSGNLLALGVEVGGGLGLVLAPALGLLAAFAIGAHLLQNRPVLAWDKLRPDWSRLSLVAGLRRYFSAQGLVEFVKNLLKLAIVAGVGLYLIWPEIDMLPQLVAVEPAAAMRQVERLAYLMLGGVLGVLGVVAAADLAWQKLNHLRQLRMSRQEVREELKQMEGDPLVKARLRAIRLDRARKRMMAAVPTADVVITNPTHYAVALKYNADDMNAPTLVAKGADLIAQKIRELAGEHGVPLVENPPLARALYTVELDREVPPEHYRAVAEIIGYVMRLKGKLKPR